MNFWVRLRQGQGCSKCPQFSENLKYYIKIISDPEVLCKNKKRLESSCKKHKTISSLLSPRRHLGLPIRRKKSLSSLGPTSPQAIALSVSLLETYNLNVFFSSKNSYLLYSLSKKVCMKSVRKKKGGGGGFCMKSVRKKKGGGWSCTYIILHFHLCWGKSTANLKQFN